MNETIVTTPTGTPNAELSATPTDTPSPWLWTQGVEGQGDRPEYLMDKYGSVSDQARGYKELLMHHNDKLKGFVGTPEEGYDRGEGNDENAMMGMLSEVGAKYGMNQDMFSELIEQYGGIMEGMETQRSDESKERIAGEIKLLGENADYRLKNIADFAKGTFDEAGAEEFVNMATTAKSVEILEQLIANSKGTKVADQTKIAPVVENANEKIREMQFAKNDSGQRLMDVDMVHRQKYEELRRNSGS
jgi:uncharacterized phage infection (PIP) family protein YhgE